MFVGGDFTLSVPESFSVEETHPDLIAAAMTLVLDPFSNGRLELPVAVSPALHDAYARATGKWLGPVDPSLAPRRAKPDARPALAFSGGFDSLGALAIMPGNTHLVQLKRRENMTRSPTNSRAAVASLEAMAALGFDTTLCESDCAILTRPVGAIHTLYSAFPAIILADHFNFDAIAFGHLVDNYFALLGGRFRNDPNLPYVRDLDPVLEAAGVPSMAPVGGLTEIGTSAIVRESGWFDLGQACIRGNGLGEACLDCPKCFRKTLMTDLVAGRPTQPETVDQLFGAAGVDRELAIRPIETEIVHMYVAARLQDEHPWMKRMARLTGATRTNTAWAERWYSPAAEMIPAQYRDETVGRLTATVEPMTPSDERRFERWNLHKRSRHVRLTVARWRFWRDYEREFDRPRLKPSTLEVRLQEGDRQKVPLGHRRGFGRHRDVTSLAVWRSRNKDVATVKSGRIKARGAGITTIVASYRGSKIGIEVAVKPAETKHSAQ